MFDGWTAPLAKGLAMVTGASSGTGFELARLFADGGYGLIVAAGEDEIRAFRQTGRYRCRVMAVQGDLRKPDEVERLYRIATEGGHRLDAAALNAGVGRAGSFLEGDLQEDLGIVDLDVRSTVHLARLVLQDVASRGTGKVLFTSLIVAGMPGWNQAMYNASESFGQSFAEALHDELRRTGVRSPR